MPLSGAITKARIVEAVVETNGYTQQKAQETIEILLERIKSTLESGDDVLISGFGKSLVKQKAKRKGRNPATGKDVLISGFGKFCVKNKKKRRGRNPATGKDLILAPRKVVTFRWSGKLKEKLNPTPATKAKKRRVRG